MNGTRTLAVSGGIAPRTVAFATIGGVLLGLAYTLSPLTVWFLFGFALLCHASARHLTSNERTLVLTLLVVAAFLRLAVVAGLFMSTDHGNLPFGSLFGDEEYFKRRSMWLRSMALDVNISRADRLYAMDEYSDTSYLYILAFFQVLMGSAPYGVHVLSIFLYLAGVAFLYRFVRRTFGVPPATLALALLLFFPTLFAWSVSALRESMHFLLTAAGLVGAVEAVRASSMRSRVAWGAMALVAIMALRDLRAGSMSVVAGSVLLGVAGALVARRLRTLAIAMLLVVAASAVAFSRPAVQQRVLENVRNYARNHQGHTFTPGLHYKVLDPQFYVDRSQQAMDSLTWPHAFRYAARAIVATVVVPLPWQPQSTLTRAYIPEYVVWLAVTALVPFGVAFGLRYSRAATLVLTAYIALMGLGVALRSGNIGTLVRHRSLILPFMIVLASVATCHLLARSAAKGTVDDASRR